MTWEQKLMALKAIASTHLEMRGPGDWFVSAYDRAVVDDGMLICEFGKGATPQEAVENDWDKITEADRIRISGKKEVRWNGYMWYELETLDAAKQKG